jgi:protease YdgD
LLLAAAQPALAQGQKQPVIPRSELPGIGAEDPRRPVASDRAPWNALGRVQTDLGNRCTGTLIAPDRVLTAAHCLLAPRTGKVVHPSSVHFLQGYAHGRFAARDAWSASPWASRPTHWIATPQPRTGLC